VRQVALVFHTSKQAAGGYQVVRGYRALQPWTDGKIWWNNWGQGGSHPGYVDETSVCRAKVSEVGNTYFVINPAVLQGWLQQPETNHGLLFKNTQVDANFHWWAHGDQDNHPPKLVIGYDVN